MLPNSDLEVALLVADRMQKAVCREPVLCNGAQLTVTISIGVASTLTPDEEISHAINRADEALYVAKSTGRNRVCGASPENQRE